MTENHKFEVGQRVNIDKQEDVLVVSLRCPLCAALGNTEAVPTPATRVWVPALSERWIPKWERGKYISLEDAILKEPALAALVKEHNGRNQAERVCSNHGKMLRAAKIWTEQLSWVMRKQANAAERKKTEAFSSIGAILAGKQDLAAAESQGEDNDAGAPQARAEQEAIQRRTLAASRKPVEPEDKPKGKGKGRKTKVQAEGSTKGRAQGQLRREIDEALERDAS